MPSGLFEARSIPNLVQGVSQQAAAERRDTQCEAQFDCINSPKLGCVARPPFEFLSFLQGVDMRNAFTYELVRGTTEHYLVVISQGSITVFDLNTGLRCKVTNSTGESASSSYLVNNGYQDYAIFRAQQIQDYTFIANKSVMPVMSTAKSPTRPKEALLFFAAGNYSTSYGVSVLYLGNVYKFIYTTPDNSVAANAPYIFTNHLAATFYKAFTGTDPNSDGGNNPNGIGSVVGALGAGGTLSAPTTLQSLGFSIELAGNLIRIWRPNDSNDFSIDATDGGGNTQLVAFKGTVQSFTQLPQFGFAGFVLQVVGVNSSTGASGSYYVAYTADGKGGGYWQEVVAPGTPTTLNPLTMPHALICRSPGVFDFVQLTWLPRISGDGVITAPNPGFVGRFIQDIFYHEGRLAIETDSTCDWSKARQYFTFFPDTVQTTLSDAPISVTFAATDSVALLRRATKVDEALMLWAQKTQFRIHSGVNAFAPATIQTPESTAYEFSETGGFCKVGVEQYFAYETDNYATIMKLAYNQGVVAGDVDVTGQVSEYIPSPVKQIAGSAIQKMLAVRSGLDAPPNTNWGSGGEGDNTLAIYNYLTSGDQLVQSAWNTWRLPTNAVLWCGIYQQWLYALVQNGLANVGGVMLLRLPLNSTHYDAGQKDYETRLDLRVSEANCVVSYSSVTGLTSITLPFRARLVSEGYPPIMLGIRTTSGLYTRGQNIPIVSTSAGPINSFAPTVITVKGNLSAAQFYVGHQIISERTESEFFVRTQTGIIPYDKITMRNYSVGYAKTGYSRIEVTQGSGQAKVKELFPSVAGVPPVLGKGSLKIGVDTLSTLANIRVVNDSFLPSRWQVAEFEFVGVQRSVVKLGAGGGPVQ